MKKGAGTVILLFVIALLIILHFPKKETYDDTTLSLESLQSDGEYQFGNIEWRLSLPWVNDKLPYHLAQDTTKGQPDKKKFTYNINYYKTKNRYVLDGQAAKATFEFVAGSLEVIKFNFHLDDDYQQWFEDQVAKLQQLYGAESDKIETFSQELNIKTIGYRWDTDRTTLQFLLTTGDTIHPSATLGLAFKGNTLE
ncbi:MAG: hypothetical protein E7293_10915 [Lachnospiraceae bacterium]|nr:hypothetical protein [Lachnospiraceae bacterium]